MVPFAGYSLPVQYEGLGVLKGNIHYYKLKTVLKYILLLNNRTRSYKVCGLCFSLRCFSHGTNKVH